MNERQEPFASEHDLYSKTTDPHDSQGIFAFNVIVAICAIGLIGFIIYASMAGRHVCGPALLYYDGVTATIDFSVEEKWGQNIVDVYGKKYTIPFLDTKPLTPVGKVSSASLKTTEPKEENFATSLMNIEAGIPVFEFYYNDRRYFMIETVRPETQTDPSYRIQHYFGPFGYD